VNAWPKKWSISSLHAEKSQLVIETIELVYQYFKKV
jgi:phage tail-like protein